MTIYKGETVETLITEPEISARIKDLAAEISDDYGEKPVTLIATLKGSLYFTADLSRKLNLLQEIEFIKASSYNKSTESSGEVKFDYTPGESLKGKHVLIIEDIIDTGFTVKSLHAFVLSTGAASVKICTLLDKPARREVDVKPDYCGFTVPDRFVVGYGLDYAEKYRNLPYIGVLSFDK